MNLPPTLWIFNLSAFALMPFTSAPARQFEVTVIVRNSCALPHGVLDEAMTTAADLFAPMGVKLRFSTDEPEEDGRNAIWLRLMQRAPHEAGMNTLGVAIIDRLPR